ncbi:MAG: deoxyhypusine synthase [Euryarchaeota archaeon]|nr:deoxyhypusine synthase [Euryarchaeota archaeon]
MRQRPVRDIDIKGGMTVAALVGQFAEAGGFTATKFADAVDITKKMLKDKDCVKFLSFPACINATGTRGVIAKMLRERMADVVITTCGTVDHDLARSWKDYYHGSFEMDDAGLRDRGVNRLGNVLVPNDSYGTIIEQKVQPFLQQMWDSGKKRIGTKELLWKVGEMCKEDSILYWAQRNKIPVYVPGITDGSFGAQLWLFSQEHRELCIDLMQDERELADIVFPARKTGALIIGGGISKHHTIWWNQFKEGLDYAVYISTAAEHDGSLSGARTREAVSWGKIGRRARHVTVDGDATILLPLLVAALK